ncbi:chaperone protein dnaJ 8, chloroplastic [Neltuma alba]|uniref:chaperone protein dnaJ 8, chloroplastic n=1 Tax=Neltuma alba TaxID=207710 RepID=UPI0010A4D86A|nr:chaperone protein dnaJ 8, chloroplastic-like [Prosopis alba]
MAAVAGAGIVAGKLSSSSSSLKLRGREKLQKRRNQFRVSCVYSSSSYVMDPYKTLRVPRDASEFEVKKAFRDLAKQYHPDVCRGKDCSVQFHEINEAYDVVMANMRGEPIMMERCEASDEGEDDQMRGMDDPDWDMWEEWMGWEGAGIRDYTSHINPYI